MHVYPFLLKYINNTTKHLLQNIGRIINGQLWSKECQTNYTIISTWKYLTQIWIIYRFSGKFEHQFNKIQKSRIFKISVSHCVHNQVLVVKQQDSKIVHIKSNLKCNMENVDNLILQQENCYNLIATLSGFGGPVGFP